VLNIIIIVIITATATATATAAAAIAVAVAATTTTSANRRIQNSPFTKAHSVVFLPFNNLYKPMLIYDYTEHYFAWSSFLEFA